LPDSHDRQNRTNDGRCAGVDEKMLTDAKGLEIGKPKRRCRETGGVGGRFGKKFCTA
jgi:hypothetical protein